ncbi:MAG TPA: ABC-F family ATP-binding cassette domain-containing protein [Propionibacteriaceae bacterium]|nr:ABC-F family ATP-binding cassette domain-containing protein [Propionibacteriaceae bacterium]
MPNLVNAERISVAFGTRTLLDEVSLGLGRADVVGVVGRNGDGKTTLLQVLTGVREPDSGRVVRTGATSIGYLRQAEEADTTATVRDMIVGGEPDHVWAAQAHTRTVVEHLLAGIDLDAPLRRLSGGERRRVGLAELLLADHDLLVLDEPTNHLDVEAVDWLATELRRWPTRDRALLVVSHDRWFLDAICTRIWEVHDGVVDGYDGGYAAYVLARAERARQAAGVAARRKNLLRKELAWLRRGPPARTSKPKFRMDAASALIDDEPPPRDRLELQQLATRRLGKDVFDLNRVNVTLRPEPGEGRASTGSARMPERVLFHNLTWSIGPGERIGIVGVNGSGKTTLLRLLLGEQAPDSGTVKRGRTLEVGYLSQIVAELHGTERVLESVERIRRQTRLATGREAGASALLEDFGFTGERLTTRLDDLSGGERRRLQFLRLLLGEPNVLLLDEPTNDLDIDTLTVLEDFLDSWPGTLLVVTHDRYFLERTCDVTYALMGDGSCVLLPGGVEQYLAGRRTAETGAPLVGPGERQPTDAAAARQARKDLARIESQLATVATRIERLHDEMAAVAADYARLSALQTELDAATTRRDELEESWLVTAEALD